MMTAHDDGREAVMERVRRVLRRQRARRGVTLVEVLIVVAIMAIIAGGATLLVFPQFKKARVEAAKVGAEAVRQAAELYMNTDAEGGACPTVQDLVAAKKLDAKKVDDPWGKPYRVVCEGDDIRVWSNGRDGKEGSPDDVADDFKPSQIKEVAEK
ncbi:MAG: prepilin-type N-terminal cleavage/methylation domain-containing protein [Polyangiaceae bacterium]